MQSPFLSVPDTELEDGQYEHITDEVMLESPFLDSPRSTNSEHWEDYQTETSVRNTDEYSNEETTESQVNDYPEMEGELTSTELSTATIQNASSMNMLGWVHHVSAIIDKLNSITGIDARDRFTRDIKYDMLARAIDRYQEMKGLKPTHKGVLAIGTWSVLQDDLGFLNYDKFKKVDTVKASKANQQYKDRLWGKHIDYILKFFKAKGYIRYELPLDGKYFAIIVAKWQSANDILKNRPDTADGILGPQSWDILRTELEAMFPGYEIKAHVKLGDTAEAARRFVGVMNTFGLKLNASLDAIENKVDLALRNEKGDSSLLREGIYLAADSLLDIAGSTPLTKAVSALGQFALGLVKKHYEEKEENARKTANLATGNSLSDLILTAKNAAVSLPDQVVVQHQFDDVLRHLYGSDKKKQHEEFDRFLNLLIELEKTVRDDSKLFQIALSRVMNFYSRNTRIVVHCQNSKDMGDWTANDLRNIIADPDRERLFLRFTNIHPQVNATDDLISSSQRKILKILWNIWKDRGYPVRQLLLDKHVFFRVHFFEKAGNFWASFPVPQAVDVYVKTIKKDEQGWTAGADILGRRGSVIQFFKKGELRTKGMDERNSEGQTYKEMILTIVNGVMRNEYNAGYNSKAVGYLEAETGTDDLQQEQADADSEIYGSYENENVEEETLSSSYSKQALLSPTFLSVDKNTKALSSNKGNLQKSGLSFTAVMTALDRYVDTNAIRQSLLAYNQKNPGRGYTISNSATEPDSIFTEGIHQFQQACYLDPLQHDGIMGRSTMESLGFAEHGLKQKLNSRGFYGQGQLDRKDVRDEVPKQTGGKYTSANWYDHLVKPSWLGVAISDGIHVILLDKLREAESWLLKQPQYQGMTPAALGKALGFNAATRYSAARLSASKQAMHGFGLALDIHVAGNPWIGAGWVQNDKVLLQERYRMIDALRKASGNASLPGETVFAYLHSIAQSAGNDTSNAYKVLKQRNDEFISYLKNNPSELNYWKASQTFGNRNPLNGFLNLHHDLVYALRQIAGLAWGAIDFGPRASGDIMHFDLRTVGIGKILCEKIGGFVPKSGHPLFNKETFAPESEYDLEEDALEFTDETELHEAVEEAEWDQNVGQAVP